MKLSEVIDAAHRAANAAGRCSAKNGGWLGEIGAGIDRQHAASFVLMAGEQSPAEALFLHAQGTPDVDWMELAPRKRVAVEVFRATILVLSRLVVEPPARKVQPRRRLMLEQETERAPRLGDRERLR